ncbi:MAG: hypothetical protein V4667_05810 [Bacteroidota bacterium]
MSHLFLINETLTKGNFSDFKEGMSELITIDRKKEDDFCKHESVYELEYYVELFANNGQEVQEIIKFIGKLSSVSNYINNDESAILQTNGKKYAFLGINFTGSVISPDKQIINDSTYKEWCYAGSSTYEKLKVTLEKAFISSEFEKEFNTLTPQEQVSIIEDFEKAKARNLKTKYYPDTKIVKDVTPNKYECSVYELRVYLPTALRVYFTEHNNNVYVGKIGYKNENDQTADIKKAHDIINKLIN